MRLSLVGPMSSLPAFNYPAFHEAADALRAVGHEVFNPAEINADTTLPGAYFMRASIGALLRAEAVVLLPGWESSPGAKTELRVALAFGLPVFAYGHDGPTSWPGGGLSDD